MPVLPLAAFPVDVAPVDEKPLSTPPAQRGPADVDSAGAAVLALVKAWAKEVLDKRAA